MAQQLTDRVRTSLLVSLGAVAFVLLIACLNVANLLLSRASDRAREIAVRTALGAGRLRMIRQLLTESLLLSAAGGIAGLLLGAWGARALVTLFPDRDPVPRLEQAHLDLAVLLFTLAVTAITGVMFGLAPALASHAFESHRVAQGRRARHIVRRALRPRAQFSGDRRDRALPHPAGRRGTHAAQLSTPAGGQPRLQSRTASSPCACPCPRPSPSRRSSPPTTRESWTAWARSPD